MRYGRFAANSQPQTNISTTIEEDRNIKIYAWSHQTDDSDRKMMLAALSNRKKRAQPTSAIDNISTGDKAARSKHMSGSKASEHALSDLRLLSDMKEPVPLTVVLPKGSTVKATHQAVLTVDEKRALTAMLNILYFVVCPARTIMQLN